MIDFHSHILPGVDDGSKNVGMSLEMLRASAAQGVTDICLTPHFYAEQNTPEKFLEKRSRAAEELFSHLEGGLPRIHLGAEVKYFEGICQCEDLELLKLQGTNIILIEMPFMNWTDRIWRDIEEISSYPNTKVMLAHLERYLQFNAEKYLTKPAMRDILIQSNAENFTSGFFQRRKAMKMLREGIIDVIGSDCHNLSSRPQNIAEARKVIQKSLGSSALERIDRIGENILGNALG